MEFLLNPNIAYLGLVITSLLITLSILTPGTGIIEALAIVAVLYSGYAIYNLPVNPLALGVLLIGVFPFILAVRRSGKLGYLVISIIALVIGSSFLFVSEGWRPIVHPVLAVVVSSLTALFMWITARKTLEAVSQPPAHGIERLIGEKGTAASDIHEEGSVQIQSELWSARSDKPIPEGAPVRVTGRDGFILLVKSLADADSNSAEAAPKPEEAGKERS